MTGLPSTNASGDVELSFSAGALLRGHVRHQLKRAEMYGAKWFETKGFLQSEFSVVAPRSIAQSINEWLTIISKEDAR